MRKPDKLAPEGVRCVMCLCAAGAVLALALSALLGVHVDPAVVSVVGQFAAATTNLACRRNGP